MTCNFQHTDESVIFLRRHGRDAVYIFRLHKLFRYLVEIEEFFEKKLTQKDRIENPIEVGLVCCVSFNLIYTPTDRTRYDFQVF